MWESQGIALTQAKEGFSSITTNLTPLRATKYSLIMKHAAEH